MSIFRMFFLNSILVVCLGAESLDATVQIFASSNNKFVLPKLLDGFYKKNPDFKVLVRYGSTGDLTKAILNGADYDIFLAADKAHAQAVYDAKRAIEAPKEYARGSLILFVSSSKTLKQKKLAILLESKIKHITMANPKSAPYGKAAIKILEHSHLLNSLKNKIRYSNDVSSAIINVVWYDDAGFISKSALNSLPLAYKKEGINWIEIDQSLYAPLIQEYVVSPEGAKKKNVQNFLQFLFSEDGRAIYQAYGYK